MFPLLTNTSSPKGSWHKQRAKAEVKADHEEALLGDCLGVWSVFKPPGPLSWLPEEHGSKKNPVKRLLPASL